MKLTSWLYRLARLERDANAIAKGPEAIGARAVRKALMRRAGGLINRLTRVGRR